MIHQRLHGPVIHAASYDNETKTMIIELTNGKIERYSPVSYQQYNALVSARFPLRIYRHQVQGVLPLA